MALSAGVGIIGQAAKKYGAELSMRPGGAILTRTARRRDAVDLASGQCIRRHLSFESVASGPDGYRGLGVMQGSLQLGFNFAPNLGSEFG
jgi:hypothetical protein